MLGEPALTPKTKAESPTSSDEQRILRDRVGGSEGTSRNWWSQEKVHGFIYVQSARTNVELFQLSISRASMVHVGYIITRPIVCLELRDGLRKKSPGFVRTMAATPRGGNKLGKNECHINLTNISV